MQSHFEKGDAHRTKIAINFHKGDALHRIFCPSSLNHYLSKGRLFIGTIYLPFTLNEGRLSLEQGFFRFRAVWQVK
jgi:hypothetical protein